MVSTVERWAMADHPVDARNDAWREAISRTHLGWELETDRRVTYPVTNAIRRRSVGRLQFIECTSGPCAGSRGARQAAADEEHIGVLFVLGGVEMVARDDVQMELAAGSIALWDSTQRMRFRVPDAVHKQTLLIPRARAGDLVPRIDRLGGTLLPPSSATRVLCDLFRSVISEQPGTADDAASTVALANAALELLAGALRTERPGEGRGERSQRWELVQDFIEHNLSDPHLSPTTIACAASVSVRALYLLFEARGDTVSRYVKRRRLTRARSELERRTDLSVATVAQRWGFSDQASFARAFRAQYALTPGQARAGSADPVR